MILSRGVEIFSSYEKVFFWKFNWKFWWKLEIAVWKNSVSLSENIFLSIISILIYETLWRVGVFFHEFFLRFSQENLISFHFEPKTPRTILFIVVTVENSIFIAALIDGYEHKLSSRWKKAWTLHGHKLGMVYEWTINGHMINNRPCFFLTSKKMLARTCNVWPHGSWFSRELFID